MSPLGSNSYSGRTPEQAFATITKAGSVAQPGDIVLVAPGTYQGTTTTKANGTESNRITYISQTPRGARIDATGYYTAWLNTGSYVDIIGFEVTGSDYLGISSQASYVHIISNWVHDLAVPSCNAPNGGAGIQHGNYSALGSQTTGNIVNNITPAGDYCNLVHGIYHSQQGGAIQNNIVFNVTAAAIHNWHAATGVTITNNLIWDSHTGILVGSDDYKGDNYIVNNNIVMNTQIGIREFGHEFGTNNTYQNNLMYNNSTDFRLITGQQQATIRKDPLLTNFQANGQGDYRPRPNSPAINAGTNLGAPATDILGTPRPKNAIDIGPFENPDGAESEH